MPSWKKVRPKVRGKKDVVDEWELADIDRNEQKMGLKRREKRWREIQKEISLNRIAEKKSIENVEKMGNAREPTLLEQAWLRCDYVLSHVMEPRAYKFMEITRIKDPDCYKLLYRIFMSKQMMYNIQYYVEYFLRGYKVQEKITLASMMKEYKKIKGIKTKIRVIHKGEEEKEL